MSKRGLQMDGRSHNDGNTNDLYKYSGKELDTENGLNLYWFDPGRAYDPMIGRWRSVDPLAALVPSLNPYHYVQNNPINRIDPFGLTDEDPPYVGETEAIDVYPDKNHFEGWGAEYGSYPGTTKEDMKEIVENSFIGSTTLMSSAGALYNDFNQGRLVVDKNARIFISKKLDLRLLQKLLKYNSRAAATYLKGYLGNLKAVGKIGIAGTILLGSIDIYAARNNGMDLSVAVGRVLGGLGGGMLGATGGSFVLPGPGTFFGAVAGSYSGTKLGGYVGGVLYNSFGGE